MKQLYFCESGSGRAEAGAALKFTAFRIPGFDTEKLGSIFEGQAYLNSWDAKVAKVNGVF